MRYTVVVPSETGAGHVAYVPAIPGCVTQGDDLPDALAMARDAAMAMLGRARTGDEGHRRLAMARDAAMAMLAVAAERGEEIPTEALGVVVASVEVPLPVAAAVDESA